LLKAKKLHILTIPYEDCKENIRDTVDLIDSLGFTIHFDKSIIIPTQEIQYANANFIIFVNTSLTCTKSLC
jgi:hypothetical protein